MVHFTGFDSAWGGKAPGAMCDLQEVDGALQFSGAPRRLSWDEAISRIDDWASWEDHVLAVDQGLVVPNDAGMRPVERKLQSALMNPFRCSAPARVFVARATRGGRRRSSLRISAIVITESAPS